MIRAAVLLCLLAGSAAASPCPRPAALVDVAATAFPLERRTRPVDGSVVPIAAARLACTPVRAPAPLGLVRFDTGDRLLIALVRGHDVVWQDGRFTDDPERNVIEAAVVADLNGDGVDELLLVIHDAGHELSGGTTLEIMEPADTADSVALLASIVLGGRGTERPTDGGYDCDSTWDLVPGPHRTRRIVTIGDCSGRRPDGFPTGQHTYALRGGALVEIAAR